MTVGETPSFTVHTFRIDAAPLYTAVSYVWGMGAASQTINLDYSSFAVRQNLWSCLHYLLATNAHRTRVWEYIWVDAICINQADDKEKSKQVRAMDRIFSNAMEVTAWLGLQRLPGYIQWRENAAKTVDYDNWFLDENVFDIAERPYWSRMWIVQEMLLAQRIRLFVSGNNFDFNDLARFVNEKPAAHAKELRRLLAYTKARDLDNLMVRRPLVDVLLEFGGCQCQDPRDRVFAIMSLVDDQDRRALGPFFPDYSLTHDAVVIITISYLRDFRSDKLGHKLDLVFDSLGVSPSPFIRRKLITASERFDVYSHLELSNKIDFFELPSPEFERDAETPGREEPLKTASRLLSAAATNSWWILTCFGLFRVRRNPREQALLNFIEQMERQALLGPRP